MWKVQQAVKNQALDFGPFNREYESRQVVSLLIMYIDASVGHLSSISIVACRPF